jgi:hypothetical protein
MANNSKLNSKQVDAVISKVAKEQQSLNAIIQAFMDIAETDANALYMLQTICNYHEADICVAYNKNKIKQAIIAAYPYKTSTETEKNIVLHKQDGVWIRWENITADIIRKAFYAAVGATKVKDFKPATEQEAQQAAEKAEQKKAERKATAEQKKADAELLKRFWDEMMKATESNCWDIVSKYKIATTETESTSK